MKYLFYLLISFLWVLSFAIFISTVHADTQIEIRHVEKCILKVYVKKGECVRK